MLSTYFNGKQEANKFFNSKRIRKTWGKLMVLFLCASLFSFFFFGRLSTILLIRHFLFLNVTCAKVFVSYEIFVIVCFVTFSLANLHTTSFRFPCNSKRFAPISWVTYFFSFLIISKHVHFQDELFFCDVPPMLKSCWNKYFIESTYCK